MPVFHEHNAIFLHIGKTGGFSIEKSLGLPNMDYKVFNKDVVYGLNKGTMTQHANLEYIQKYITADQARDYYKFTIVRNPWDRMVSAFFYLYDGHVKRFETFEKWLDHKYKMVINGKYKQGSHYTPQIEYTHKNGTQVVDFVGRFESLDDSFETIVHHLNLKNTPLKHINISKKRGGHYNIYYNDKSKKQVEEMYGEEIDFFKYNF